MRKKIVAGNWKMNMDYGSGLELIQEISNAYSAIQLKSNQELILLLPFIHLHSARAALSLSTISLGAQNVHHESNGAFTGEVSAEMLSSLGIKYCLVGHSERRLYQKESDEELISKVKLLLEKGICPVFCVGESLSEREARREKEVVRQQLSILFSLSKEEFSKLVLAYEPVWAIGTGKTASSDQAQEMHAFIRSEVNANYNSEVSESVSILYGGSCKPDNAAELFSKADVDGGLIGGASLDASSFLAIFKALKV